MHTHAHMAWVKVAVRNGGQSNGVCADKTGAHVQVHACSMRNIHACACMHSSSSTCVHTCACTDEKAPSLTSRRACAAASRRARAGKPLSFFWRTLLLVLMTIIEHRDHAPPPVRDRSRLDATGRDWSQGLSAHLSLF